MITTLVLLGQVLELKARSRTSSALRELLNLAPPIAHRLQNNIEENISLGEVKWVTFCVCGLEKRCLWTGL